MGFASTWSERITSEDHRYWSRCQEECDAFYDHGVGAVVYGTVILRENELLLKNSPDHHRVWISLVCIESV